MLALFWAHLMRLRQMPPSLVTAREPMRETLRRARLMARGPLTAQEPIRGSPTRARRMSQPRATDLPALPPMLPSCPVGTRTAGAPARVGPPARPAAAAVASRWGKPRVAAGQDSSWRASHWLLFAGAASRGSDVRAHRLTSSRGRSLRQNPGLALSCPPRLGGGHEVHGRGWAGR
jgi:hypothetical protein